MRHVFLLLAAIMAAPAAAPAAHAEDARFGTWRCALPTQPFGDITLWPDRYDFAGTDYAPSGTGLVQWTSEAFALSQGPLARFGVTSGLVYPSPDPALPGVMVDLYSGIGVAVHCEPLPQG